MHARDHLRPPVATRLTVGAGVAPMAIVAPLLALDLTLIAADLLARNAIVADPRLLLSSEGGFAEHAQHLKAAVAAILLFVTAWRRGSIVTVVWGAALAFVLADDAGQLHERAGLYFGAALSLPEIGGLRANHAGELLFYGVVGLLFLLAFAGALRANDPDGWRITRHLAGWFVVLAAVVILLDALHSLWRKTWAGPIFAVAEDGGELVALTVLLSRICVAFVGSPAEDGVQI